MPIYKPTELHEFLNGIGINPKKGLSQNFLIDGNIIRKIAAATEPTPNDLILEIGPGPGSLTENLLATGARILAVEKDETLAHALERLKKPDNHLEVFCQDIMQFPFEEVLSSRLKEGQRAKVSANLPYHLTTPIVASLITKRHLFSRLVLMVQDEVAKRFTAVPNNKEYGSFSVFLNFYTNPKYGFLVSNQCFYPPPKVQSAIVILDLKEPPAVSNVEKFFTMTRTAFHHRRKMMRGSLKELYEPAKVMEALEAIGVDPLARPEILSLDQFLALFAKLEQGL